MLHLASEQVGAQARVAVARRQDDLAEVGLEAGHRGGRGRRRGHQSRADGGDRRVVAGRAIRLPEHLLDEVADPGQLVERRLGLETPDRPVRTQPDERLPGGLDDRRHPLEAAGHARQSVDQWREVRGR